MQEWRDKVSEDVKRVAVYARREDLMDEEILRELVKG